jgi:hypothetical protein
MDGYHSRSNPGADGALPRAGVLLPSGQRADRCFQVDAGRRSREMPAGLPRPASPRRSRQRGRTLDPPGTRPNARQKVLPEEPVSYLPNSRLCRHLGSSLRVSSLGLAYDRTAVVPVDLLYPSSPPKEGSNRRVSIRKGESPNPSPQSLSSAAESPHGTLRSDIGSVCARAFRML